MASRGSLFEDTLEIGLGGQENTRRPSFSGPVQRGTFEQLGVYLATQIPGWQAQAHPLPSVAET